MLTIKYLKDRTWDACSIYIRQKYIIDGSGGLARCYTCRKLTHWTKLQAGHGIGGRNNAVLFKEEILRPQCLACNVFLHGNYTVFTRRLIEENGLETYKQWEYEARQPKEWKENELWDLLKKFSPEGLKVLISKEVCKIKNKAKKLRINADALERKAIRLEKNGRSY